MRISLQQMTELEEAIEHQANMQTLWPLEPTITEAMLAAALRHLHAIIEDEKEVATLAKKTYWDLESEL